MGRTMIWAGAFGASLVVAGLSGLAMAAVAGVRADLPDGTTPSGVSFKTLYTEGLSAGARESGVTFGVVTRVSVSASGIVGLFGSQGAMLGDPTAGKGVWALTDGKPVLLGRYGVTTGFMAGERPIVDWSMGEDGSVAAISYRSTDQPRKGIDTTRSELFIHSGGEGEEAPIGKIGGDAGGGFEYAWFERVTGPMRDGRTFVIAHLARNAKSVSDVSLCVAHGTQLTPIKLPEGSTRCPSSEWLRYGAGPTGQLVVEVGGTRSQGTASAVMWFLDGDQLVAGTQPEGSRVISRFSPLTRESEDGGIQVDARGRVLGLCTYVDGGEGVVLLGRDEVAHVATLGKPTAGNEPSLTVEGVKTARLAPDGQVLLMVDCDGGEQGRTTRLIVWDGSSLRAAASVGDAPPGVDGRFAFDSFTGGLAIGEGGRIAFLAQTRPTSLSEASPPPSGLWGGKPGDVRRLLLVQDSLAVSPSERNTVTKIQLAAGYPVTPEGRVIARIETLRENEVVPSCVAISMSN